MTNNKHTIAVLLGRDLRQNGLTLERMGLGALTVPQLKRLVGDGTS